MAGTPAWTKTLRAAREEVMLAARLYNDSAETRAFQGFVVHMHIAWLYLLHARFKRDGTDYRYRRKDNPRQFVTVDGEHKWWELARCVEERWPNADDPVRRNLEFFIGLRNRVEHRHNHRDSNLAVAVGGHAQALLLNFEHELTGTFGESHSLATVLRFPLFVGSFTTEGTAALRTLRDRLPADLKRFIAEFHTGLTDDVAVDPRFELRLRVVLEQAQRASEDSLAIQFLRWDDLTEEQRRVIAEVGKMGQTIVREQKRSIVGHGLLRPAQAEQMVQAAIPFRFNSYHFLRSWQIKGIRPRGGGKNPERTDEKYCIYDELSGQYGYTAAWVKWLTKQCMTADGFEKVTGRKPEAKS